jgi:hypothetical protein
VYFKESSELPVEPTAGPVRVSKLFLSPKFAVFSDVFCTASYRTISMCVRWLKLPVMNTLWATLQVVGGSRGGKDCEGCLRAAMMG